MNETVIASSVLIAVIILLRTLLKDRLSNTARYGLWLIAAVRLMFPVSLIESHVSVMNLFSAPVAEETATLTEHTPQETVSDNAENASEMNYIADTAPQTENITASESSPKKNISAEKTAVIIHYSVTGAMILWFIIVNGTFAARLSRSEKRLEYDCPLKVCISDEIASPCIFGLFRPTVYVTSKAAEDRNTLRFVVSHELCHYYHGDTFWAVLRYFLLAFYWFDPFVWAAAVLSKRDCECACDEAVIRRIGADRRFEYGKALIGQIPEKRGQFGIASTSMSAEGRVLRERISFIAKNPRNTASAVIIAVGTALLAVCVTFTSAVKTSAEKLTENISPEETRSVTEYTVETEQVLSEEAAPVTESIPDRTIADDLFSENIAEKLGADGTVPWEYSDESFGYIYISVPSANSSSVIGELYLWQGGDISMKIVRNSRTDVPENAEVTEGTFCEKPCILYERKGERNEIGITVRDFEDGSYTAVIEYSSESDEVTAKRILSTIQPMY